MELIMKTEAIEMQQHFRLIMDSMARPGKVNKLEGTHGLGGYSLNNASLWIACTLLSKEVHFQVVPSYAELEGYLMKMTGSFPVPVSMADYILIGVNADAADLKGMRKGDLYHPERGAFIILDAGLLSETPLPAGNMLVLEGPGIKTTNTVYVTGLNVTLLVQLLAMNGEYPTGIDILVTDRHGRVLGLPRTTKIMINNTF